MLIHRGGPVHVGEAPRVPTSAHARAIVSLAGSRAGHVRALRRNWAVAEERRAPRSRPPQPRRQAPLSDWWGGEATPLPMGHAAPPRRRVTHRTVKCPSAGGYKASAPHEGECQRHSVVACAAP
eukprot:scaffold175_cov414-Prasinococcus_capsulatus_cf.AAC.42